MKKFNLTFVFCLTVYFLSAQDYLVTFSGSGESTTVSTVTVENMTQGKSLTLNGNETLHLKSTLTEISDLENNRTEGIQFYPNPMKEFSVMEFAMPEEGAAKIELFDISGRKLTQVQNYLNQGLHSYRITGVGNGIYVLKVTAGNYVHSGKLLSDNKTGEMVNIIYQNTIPFNDNPAVMKSANSEILMQCNTGDMLKFFATGGEHKSVKVEVITESKNIDFAFYKCTDPDNRNYATVKIGTQIWMAENLAFLPAVSPPDPGSSTEPRYYVYDYIGTDVAAAKLTANYSIYGILYNWPAAKAACPPGWHLPSEAEWTDLITFLGGIRSSAGGKLKETRTAHWNSPNTGATNESGFSALPGGNLEDGYFGSIGSYGFWWSATEISAASAFYQYLKYYNSDVVREGFFKVYGYSVRCVRDDYITTTAVTDIKLTTATSGGKVTADGGDTVTARGVCWNTTGSPTISDSITNNGTGTGSFTSSLTGLIAGTLYYVRAFATNSEGTVYGSQVIFTTPTGAFTDSRDGRTYNNVIINDKEWMAENLAYLPAVSPSTAGSYTEPYYYVNGYEGTDVAAAKDNQNYKDYGVLYNWPAAKAACPPGWHLPSDEEWTALTNFLGGEGGAGDKMKETGTAHWFSPNTDATNESGFSALPGSYRGYDEFIHVGYYGFWWSATEYSTTNAWSRQLRVDSYVDRTSYKEEFGFSVRCVRDDYITTTAVTDIKLTTATSGGKVTADGGDTVTARGVCWNTTGSPTISDSKTNNGTGTGSFTSSLTGLIAGTLYYVRAFATNSEGTVYGSQVIFTTSNPTGAFTDSRDGRTYNTVIINGKEWMAENLAYLPAVSPSSAGSYTEPYYYVYGYEGADVAAAKDKQNYKDYGVLYNWPAAKAACPPGWHLPSDDEWTALTTWLGGESVAGGKMKETGTTHWLSTNTGATNESGFSALPCGSRYSSGGFYDIGSTGGWWSSTEDHAGWALFRGLTYYFSSVGRGQSTEDYGLSVRCVRNN
jgi:uncharacterized protein (TIGR02145 family)